VTNCPLTGIIEPFDRRSRRYLSSYFQKRSTTFNKLQNQQQATDIPGARLIYSCYLSKKTCMQRERFSNNIIRTVSIAMLVTQLCCYKLFGAHPGFPSLPVAGIFGGWPAVVQSGLFYTSLLLMVVTAVRPMKPVVALLLALQLVICLADQNRWQPWQYQYLFMLGVYLFVASESQRRWGWQIILISTYFFSALWKMQPAFIHDVWLKFILYGWVHIYDMPAWAYRAGYALPLAEMGAVIMLCFAPTRRIGMWTLVGMHSLVLLMMGPLGMMVNYVLWPWNAGMIAFLLLLFNRYPVEWSRQQLKPVFNLLVILCWAVLPWLQSKGKWDRYLSSVLFSGGAPYMYISTTNPVAMRELKPYFRSNCTMPYGRSVSTYDWASREMHTIPYPEHRSFINIARQWQERYQDTSARFFILTTGFKPVFEEIDQKEVMK
jgi:hypothetical protein